MPSKSRIAQLDGDKNSYDFTGLVVALYETRSLTTRKGLRYVFGMVVRDSPDDFIYGQVWGSREYLSTLLSQLSVNRWVKLNNVAISTKDSQMDEQYHPWTPSNFTFSAQENTSHIDLVQGIGVPGMDNLKNLPVRDHNDFYKLADLEKIDPAQLASKYFNLLFAIREIGQVQLIKGTKSDKSYSKLELVVFDDTNNSLPLQMWDGEFIRQVSQWKPYHNIVFAVGVRIERNSFTNKLLAKTTSKTIFTTNPDTKEAFRLYSYAKKIEGKLPELIPEIDQIKRNATKCTVQELKEQLTSQSMAQNEFVLLNAVITCFDVDRDPATLFTFKCKRCSLKLSEKTRKCPNKNCSDPSIGYEKSFDRPISLTDHTATLTGVRVTTKLFETMVGHKVEEFMNLDETKRTSIKWSFEFERKLALVKIAYKMTEDEDRLNYYFRLIDLDEFAFEQ